MAYCVRCGEKVDDTVVTCPACGAAIPKKEEKQGSEAGNYYTYGDTETNNSSYTYGDAGAQDSGYTYGNAGAQGSGGYTYGNAGMNGNSGYTYGNAGAQDYRQCADNAHRQAGADSFPESEIRKNKAMAVLCYLGVLVFIPVLAGDKESEYVKLHKNQGMILFIAETFLNIVERYRAWSAGIFAWFTGGVVDVGVDIARFVVLILFIMGIVYACRGTRNELPGIGKIKIFK